jgi:hypothetical protein
MAPRTKSKEIIDAEQLFDTPPASAYPATLGAVSDTGVEYDDVTALNNVLAELGADESGGFVVVHREVLQPNGKRDDEYLDRFPVSEFSLNNLKAQWGAGKYKINVYHNGGGGLAARKSITIARDPTATPPATAQPAQPAQDLTPLLQTMNQGFEKMIGVLVASQQKAPSRMEMLQEMQIMREMLGGTAQPAAPAYDPVSLLKLGVEMASNGAGGGESNNSWVNKVIDQFSPLLVPAIAGAMQGQNQPAPRRPAAPAATLAAPATPAAAPAAPVTPSEEAAPMNIIVGQYLKMLKSAAEKRAPVDEYADSILATVPPSMVPDIEAMLKPDDWRDRIRQHTDAADAYPEWFGQLREVLLQFIEEDKQSASTHLTGAPSGDSVANHENADTGNGQPTEGHTPGAA